MLVDLEEVRTEPVRPISRREFQQMADAGMFDDEHVELLCGVIVMMTAQSGAHSGLTAWFMRVLGRTLDWNYDVRAHSPYAADNFSQPEPDVIVSSKPVSLLDHPSESLLIIEVSNSSGHRDRGIKRRLYAKVGVPEYWIVNVKHRTIDVYTQPRGKTYEHHDTLGVGDVLRPTKLPQVEIAYDAIPWPPVE